MTTDPEEISCLKCRDSGWLYSNYEEPEPCPDCTDFNKLWEVENKGYLHPAANHRTDAKHEGTNT